MGKASRRPEDEIQRAVFKHIAQRGARGLFAFAVPNGGYRRPAEAAILKGLGVTAGVPDVIAVHEGRCYALELKAKGGKLSENQEKAGRALEAAGARWAVCEGLDAALFTLENWGLLRGQASLADPPFAVAP